MSKKLKEKRKEAQKRLRKIKVQKQIMEKQDYEQAIAAAAFACRPYTFTDNPKNKKENT